MELSIFCGYISANASSPLPPSAPHLHLSLHGVKGEGKRLAHSSSHADIGKVLQVREAVPGSIPDFLQVHVD